MTVTWAGPLPEPKLSAPIEEGSVAELLALRKIIETVMTQHWDLAACPCWVCEEGREAQCRPRDIYLSYRHPEAKRHAVRVESDYYRYDIRTRKP